MLALAVPGCTACEHAASRSRLAVPDSNTTPAFVVYQRDDVLDGDHTTLILPIVRSGQRVALGAAIESEGMLVLDERPPGRVLLHGVGRVGDVSDDLLHRIWDLRCPLLGSAGNECSLNSKNIVNTWFEQGIARRQTNNCECYKLPYADKQVFEDRGFEIDDTFYGTTYAGTANHGYDLGLADAEEREAESCAAESEDASAWFLGGVYQQGTQLARCPAMGLDGLASAAVELLDLLPDATLPRRLPERPTSRALCITSNGYGIGAESIGWTAPPPGDPRYATPTSSGALCYPTEGEAEEDYAPYTCSTDHGEIWSVHRGHLVHSALGDSGKCTIHEVVPVRPELCTDPADPCGGLAAFRDLAERPAQPADFWVGRDEAFALVWGERPTVVASGGALVGELASPPAGDVIGVRYHADVTPLLAVATALNDAEPSFSWYPWPLQMASVPQPAPPRPVADLVVDDRGDGRAWGNRCFSEYKAKHLDAARAACERGLSIATADATRAAIYHSLGRIAEASGVLEDAAIYYRTSLALRPREETAAALRSVAAAAWADDHPADDDAADESEDEQEDDNAGVP